LVERLGGEGVDGLLEVTVIVEREEMNRVKRQDAWGPGTPILEQPMPHSPVFPFHLTPASLRPRP